MDVGDLPGFDEGLVSVQDAAAQLAAHLLEPQAGERILDACAAPGGKTGHLLELAPELAALTAVDVSPERLLRVTQNLQRLGLTAQLIAADAAEPAAWWDGQGIQSHSARRALFGDRRDPPPSGYQAAAAGAMTSRRWRRASRSCCGRCGHCCCPAAGLLYASCSALQAETTAVVAAFLADEPSARDATADRLKTLPTFGPGAATDHLETGLRSGRCGRRRFTNWLTDRGRRRRDGWFLLCSAREVVLINPVPSTVQISVKDATWL